MDSERNFNGSADPMITADRGFIQILGPDFGFCLFGSSDRGSLFREEQCLRDISMTLKFISFSVTLLPFTY